MSIIKSTTADNLAIGTALTCYCSGIDKRDPALLESAFWNDAYIDYGELFHGSLSDFISWATDSTATVKAMAHILGQSVIVVEGDEATVETYVTAYGVLPADQGEALLLSVGRYHDRFERRGEDWRIAERRLSMDLQHIQPLNSPRVT